MLFLCQIQLCSPEYSIIFDISQMYTQRIWKAFSSGGKIEVWVEGVYIGKIQHYFDAKEPLCAQDGTLVYENRPGTYNFKAEGSSRTWNGTFTIGANGCRKKELLKN